jgi:hypothetical protein
MFYLTTYRKRYLRANLRRTMINLDFNLNRYFIIAFIRYVVLKNSITQQVVITEKSFEYYLIKFLKGFKHDNEGLIDFMYTQINSLSYIIDSSNQHNFDFSRVQIRHRERIIKIVLEGGFSFQVVKKNKRHLKDTGFVYISRQQKTTTPNQFIKKYDNQINLSPQEQYCKLPFSSKTKEDLFFELYGEWIVWHRQNPDYNINQIRRYSKESLITCLDQFLWLTTKTNIDEKNQTLSGNFLLICSKRFNKQYNNKCIRQASDSSVKYLDSITFFFRDKLS